MRMLARLMYVAATLAGATKAREEDFIPWPKERTERAEERKHQVDEAKNVSVNLGAFE